MDINKLRLKNKKFYLIASTEKSTSNNDFLDAIANELKNGIEVVELREKYNAKRMIELGKRIRELCSIYNALFIIYDRLDIAQIVHADGVLLEEDSIDVETTREILGSNFIIGIQINKENDNFINEIDKADYIICNEKLKNISKIHNFSNIKKIF